MLEILKAQRIRLPMLGSRLTPADQDQQSGVSFQPGRVTKILRMRCSTEAFAAIRSHQPSREYYERKRTEGKRHNAALICLARRRCNVIYAMLKNKEFFREIPPKQLAA